LRVKFHDQSPYFGCDCRFTVLAATGVEKAGQPCFFNARNSAAHRDRNAITSPISPVMAGVQVMALKETRAVPDKNRGHIPARKLHRFERLPAKTSAPVHWRQRFQLVDVPGLGDLPRDGDSRHSAFPVPESRDQLRIRIERRRDSSVIASR
jgi:hypothetical protein